MPVSYGGGAGGPIGRRASGSLERIMQERRAKEPPQLTPQSAANAMMGNVQKKGFVPGAHNENDYTLMDFAKQVYGFPGKVYDDMDQTVRGLIDLGSNTVSNVLNDQTPFEGIEGDELVSDTFHNLTDPVGYANEHPFGFMADVAGGAMLGEAALGRAAAARSASIPEWLGSEEGSIGRLGERIERGYEPSSVEPVGDSPFNTLYSASEPDLAHVRFPDEGLGGLEAVEGRAVVKPVKPPVVIEALGEPRIFHPPNQALNEAAASELNAKTGNTLRMPGSWYHEDLPYRPRLRAETGFVKNYTGELGPVERGPGSLTEYLEGLNAGPYGNGLESFDDWANPMTPEWTNQMRRQNIFDQVIGNADRSYGANLFEHEGLPIAVDQGSSFPRQMGLDSFYEPRAWPTEGKNLTPDELSWVDKMIETMGLNAGRSGSPLGMLEQSSLRNAINRARELLENRKLDPDFGWHNNLGT